MLLNPLLPTTTTKTTTLMMTRAGRPTTQGRTPKPLKRHHHPCVDVRSAKKEEKAKQPKGGLTKKRCDACLGAGKVPCYNCTTKLTGWGDGRAVSVADKVGYVPKKTSLFSLPFGWKTTSSSANNTKKTKKKKTKDDVNDDLVRCPACAETTPGKLVCSRCQGQGSLYYRSAEWK